MEYYSFSTEYGAADELFKAILSLDKKRVSELRAAGVTLSEDVKRVLVNGGGSMVSNKPETRLWYLYLIDIKGIDIADFVYISREFYRETDATLYYSETVRDAMWGKFFSAEVFRCFLDCYDQTKMNKTRLMKGAIDSNSVECLVMCAEHGWLKMPRKRDEMIDYAAKENKTECTAFLLEFKNKNFNLAEERVKAEKKIERELNASPNSVSELKKLWSCKKREDGGLIITSYKGKQTEVVVPERIGKSTVSAIGSGAFSGMTWSTRITSNEICDFRKENITRITLPETVTVIGENAFSYCSNLKAVNVPYGVKVIEKYAFRSTGIEAMELPETVECIKDYAFWGCRLRTIKLPQSLMEIKSDAFSYSWLEKIEIPSSVKVISKGSFWHCANLKEVILNEGIEEIMPAFLDCQSLEKINLPASIKNIVNYKRDEKTVSPFADSHKLTATVERDSYAEEYCAKNNITFEYKGGSL
ncbi:MAG: leucine-rich repeat domain-containing protein [Oscillospiraceae bacterium]|nr:leucine-rich repeat domain-containing protein [Oscillospiraceae bacterium]